MITYEEENPPPKLTHTIRWYQEQMYKYCRGRYPDMIKIAKMLLARTKNEYDNHVTIEGGTGCGKSMFTFILVHIIHYLSNTKFNLLKQTLFIPDEGQLKKSLSELKSNDVYWLDEAIRALDKKQWYKVDQIEMNQMVKTERWKCCTVLYNIQRFAELTETFRNDNIHFRIYIVKRHSAIFYVKHEDKDLDDVWHIRENLSIKYRNHKGQFRYDATWSPDKMVAKETKLPNALFSTRIPNLFDIEGCEEYWRYYEWLKIKSREDARLRKNMVHEDKKLNKYEKKYKEIVMQFVKEDYINFTGTKKDLFRGYYNRVMSEHVFLDLIKEIDMEIQQKAEITPNTPQEGGINNLSVESPNLSPVP